MLITKYASIYFYSAFVALFVAVVVGFYPSISVPFYLDDYESIVSNPLLHADSLVPLINGGYKDRIVGYTSIWLNYQMYGLEPAAYHVTNILIHIVNTLLVYWLVLLVFNFFNGVNNGKGIDPQNRYWALAVAAIWALHPLNSQVVIYVVQRLSSISALFIFLTAICYLLARQSQNNKQKIVYVGFVTVFAVLGFYSKQNYLVIVPFLLLWELLTADSKIRRSISYSVLTLLIAIVFVAPFIPEFWSDLDNFTRDRGATDRLSYFYTQMIVLWEYIGRYFYPFELQLEIDVILRRSLEPIVALAMLCHIALIVIAYHFRKTVPLFIIGLVWFYSSHMVESFIIPIKDLAFEHRTYTGNMGLTLAVVGLIKFIHERFNHKKIQQRHIFVAISIIVGIGATLNFHRSQQWQDPLSFYANEVTLAPEHPRANASYGNELLKRGELQEAEKYLKKSIDLYLAKNTISASLLNAYMTVLYQQQKYQGAARIVNVALKYVHHPIRRSTLLSNLAVGYIYMGFCNFAVSLLDEAIRLNPSNQDARTNIAYCHNKMSQE